MIQSLKALHDKELAFAQFSARVNDHDGPELGDTLIAEFSSKTAEYNKEINVALKEYALIDYKSEPAEKIRSKAFINYAYDFIALLMDIVRCMNEEKPDKNAILHRFDLIEDFLLQKDQLVNTIYFTQARDELNAFHDPDVRAALEEKLSRMIRERKGSA